MDERYIKARRNAYDRGEHLSNEQEKKFKRLAKFPELIKRVQSSRWVAGYIDSTPLQPTKEQKKVITALNRWRTASFITSR